MSQIRSISIVGTGNVAFHLGNALMNAGYPIADLYGRDLTKVSELSETWNCSIAEKLSDLSGDLVIICVNDSSIQQISLEIPSTKAVVHTSGAISMEVLNSHDQFGVFYPLQTISKNRKLDFEEIPILLESNDMDLLNQLDRIAGSLSKKSVIVSGEERKSIHLAAVFVNNFVNHLVLKSKNIMDERNLDWNLLLPLLDETVNKIKELGPLEAQTGPARRNDEKTINEHLVLLSGTDKELYRLLTESIKKTYLE